MNTPMQLKWMAVLTLLSFISATLPAPTPARAKIHLLTDYVAVDEQGGRCRFSFPAGYRRETQSELDQVIYTVESDNLSFQMHYVNTANVESISGSNSGSITSSVDPNARLNQFVVLLAQATNGQVISQYTVYTSGQEGREVELTYTEPEGDQTIRMLSRFFWQNDRMYVFSVAAPTQYTNTLLDARNTLFNSVQFY